MTGFINFLIVISAGLVFSGLFSRVKIPYVTALIISGIIVGPHAFNLIVIDETMETLASIGIVFLMFMAGLEVDVTQKKEFSKNTLQIILLNGIVPFVVGYLIGYFLGYKMITSLILGITFISSSVAVLTPQLEESGIIKRKLGKTILTSTMVEDVISLILLSLALQTVAPKTKIPVLLYIPIVVLSLAGMKVILRKTADIEHWLLKYRANYEGELRFVFTVLIASAIYFEALGMHSIIAGFVVGILLSETIKHEEILTKIHTLSYGLFIPIFFVIIGAKLDLGVFLQTGALITIVLITAGAILAKMISGYFAGKLSGFTKLESMYIGVATTPQLSTTLAAAFSAFEFGLLNDSIITALVVLSVVTTLISPIMLDNISNKITSQSRTR